MNLVPNTFKQFVAVALSLALMAPLHASAGSVKNPCQAKGTAVKRAISARSDGAKQVNNSSKTLNGLLSSKGLPTSTKNFAAAYRRANQNYANDHRDYSKRLDDLQRAYERTDFKLNYLQSAQIGGFVGTIFGGGWGLNNNIRLNSQIDALKGQKHYISEEQNRTNEKMRVTLARDEAAITKAESDYEKDLDKHDIDRKSRVQKAEAAYDKSMSKYEAANVKYEQALDGYQACIDSLFATR